MTDLYDRKGRIIGSFALEKRIVVNYDDFAPVLRQAVISIEDKNFESHWGINVFRIAGALWHDIRSHGRAQGASTLTMQLARNLFLSSDRTATRKIQEAYLAIQIERAFTKEQIFTLYGNQIYLGSGMYGFEAASEYYFSKHAKDLNLTEAALLAGLPKGPVAYSPLLNPENALRRRNLVLSEMESDGVITHVQAEQARRAPLGLHINQPEMSVAPWFQEEVRRELEKQFGAEEVHEAGLRVDTTLDLDLQKTANQLSPTASQPTSAATAGRASSKMCSPPATRSTTTASRLGACHRIPATTFTRWSRSALPLEIHARVGSERTSFCCPQDWAWTGQRYGDALVKPGDIIYVHLADATEGARARATLEQDSGAQGALLAMDNTTGDVLAMVGGRDYALSEFNRATQAERQTGSSFKPYVYTAAIEDGAKPDDIIVDAPVSFGSYSPHNYENDYKGAMTLANAFAESRNIPAVKLAARVGIHKVIDMAHRFGVTSEHSRLSARRPRRGGDHASGTGRLLLRLPQRRHPRHAAPHPQSLQRRRHHPLGGHARRQRSHQPANRAHHDDAVARRHRARHRRRRRAAEPSPRRQNRNHQRLHRRLVPGLFALRHLRRLGRLRQPRSRSAKKRPAPAPPCPSGWNFMQRRHRRQRRRTIPRRHGVAAVGAGQSRTAGKIDRASDPVAASANVAPQPYLVTKPAPKPTQPGLAKSIFSPLNHCW